MSRVSIRYMIDDVPAAINFYRTHLGFALDLDASPAFAAVSRDGVRLLLSGKTSSGRRAMPDGSTPVPGGWNRIHIEVDDLEADVKRLCDAGLKFRNEIVKGPGGSQILLDDPSGGGQIEGGEVLAKLSQFERDIAEFKSIMRELRNLKPR